ncbi:MAG: DUF475 domain-containing protein [Burkholderiaceae bacterium]|jgi:hypothetical protein|nr:DUF475 domain-containing protein [Burkholderiaceae bacterium]
MKTIISHFWGSFTVCIVAVIAAFFLGGIGAVFTVCFLTALEVALSFDNAVVNAGVLEHWDDPWRQRFLLWGILVAVFLMRLIFPLLIVSLVGNIAPTHAIDLAIYWPDEYARIMASAHHQIAAFGGAFLLMVCFSFFVARHKTEHWLFYIEKPLTKLGQMEAIEAAIALLVIIMVSYILPQVHRNEFILAGMWGVITFILTKGMASLLNPGNPETAQHIVRQGVGGFLYLELIDASFSFDGVLGAFALTNNLFIIALGLGAGAMFVRSFTILLVHKGTLGQYRYLEHGAFWAIGALALLMLFGVNAHIPEAVTGLLGAFLIIASLFSSILANRRERTRKH